MEIENLTVLITRLKAISEIKGYFIDNDDLGPMYWKASLSGVQDQLIHEINKITVTKGEK